MARHIPEEELHAYLDQALSRSQCVEIEHHLAGCQGCRAERDGIAALRDRTTALLVAASPRRIRPRPYTQLSTAHLERVSRRAHRLRNAAWAASVTAALGLGWGLSQWSASTGTPEPRQATATTAPLTAPPITAPLPVGDRDAAPAVNPVRTASSTPGTARRPNPSTASSQDDPEMSDEEAPPPPPRPATSSLASLGSTAATDPVLNGLWRTVAWTNTPPAEAGGDWVPRVEGVPVVQVKMRQGAEGGRPITLVTQQLANGEMISTVEGPATEVAELLSHQSGQRASAELQDMQAAPHQVNASGQRTAGTSAPRTLAIFGSAPSDSLKAFMLRVK